MKKAKYIIVLFLGFITTSSCNNWLSVTPKTEITQKDLFKTEAGFKDALIGVYIQLKDDKSYGYSLTMEAVEYLVNFWDPGTKTTEEYLALHNYSEAGCTAKIKDVYGQLYTIITSANSILNNIDHAKNEGVFKTTGMYEIIKGEALAIRAMCHLDILRLFGPVPSLATNRKILSYVTTVDKIPSQHVDFNTYSTQLIKDINEAQDLLKKYDPIVTKVVSADDFLSARHLRFNYFAARALCARANLYVGNKAEALEVAKDVINEGEYQLGTMSDLNNEDYALKNEHIFAIHDFKLAKKYSDKFANGILYKGKSSTTVKRDLYGNSGTDIRENNLWELKTQANSLKTNVILKYFGGAENNEGIRDTRIPILRISEMYLIVVETAPLEEAKIYWKAFRESRSIGVSELTEATRDNEILKEFRKEFYAEGQMFYFYKRVNAPKTDILWFSKSTDATLNYTWPLPKTEIID